MYGNNFTLMLEELNEKYGSSMYMSSRSHPLQVEGGLDKMLMYFRARHGDWRFVMDKNDPVLATEDIAVFYHEGEYDDIKNLDADNLNNLLEMCIHIYLQERDSD